MNNYTNITIFWIGRFLRHGGYGVATRELYKALKKLDINVVGIDSDNNLPIDDSGYDCWNKTVVFMGTYNQRIAFNNLLHDFYHVWNFPT